MSRAAFSAKVFAVYLFVLGPALALVPDLALPVFRLAPTNEVWVRVLGVLVFNVGVYVWVCAKHENRPFLEASVAARVLMFVALAAFVIAGLASPMFALFGLVDLSGGIWTYLALKADARSAAAAPLNLSGSVS